MGKCVVKSCDSQTHIHNKTSGITFHRIPTDRERRLKWVERIRLLRRETDWIPTKYSLICSKHFREQDKLGANSEGGRVYLYHGALPILVNNSNPDVKMELLVEDTLDDVETDEEINEIIESPREHEMRKIIYQLRKVSARRLNKIRSLAQKNKRLTIRNKNFKEIIKDLKNKCMGSKEEMQPNVKDKNSGSNKKEI